MVNEMAPISEINQSVALIKAQRECQLLQQHYDELLHRCVAVCCSVLQCVAVWCSVIQRECQSLQQHYDELLHRCVAVCCSVLQCDTVWCSVVQCAAVQGSVSQRFKFIKV